jgi:predicted CXXCH cytochrome family protein
VNPTIENPTLLDRPNSARGFLAATRWGFAAALGAAVALWLFVTVFPVQADGGPHVAALNSGASTLTADTCAGCHRAHTAQGPLLLTAASDDALCLTCHGAAGTGATTDVMTGVQYSIGTPGTLRGGSVLGALRGGGFDQARIASGAPARVLQAGSPSRQWAKVGVGAPQDVTSAHLNLPENALTAPAVAWGNGANLAGVGPTVALGCTSCHNPHGNGQYRILNPVPSLTASTGTFSPIAAPGALVTDSPVVNAATGNADTKNYTVIQVPGPQYLLYASQVASGLYPATSGDYWHVRVPWNSSTASNDAPNGVPVNAGAAVAFDTQITAWCSACHTRYNSVTAEQPSGDNLYMYRHQTVSNQACTTCHVAHGSNALMTGQFSGAFPYPGGTPSVPTLSPSSRLLKVDNRGTCQLCHDPTRTVATGTYVGPLPMPGAP